jgi:hypothetical protein
MSDRPKAGVAGQTASTTRRLERQIAKGSDELPPQRKERGRALQRNCAKTVLLAATCDTTGARGRLRAKVEISANNPASCGIPERILTDSATPGPASNGGSRFVGPRRPVAISRGTPIRSRAGLVGRREPAASPSHEAAPPARLPSPWPWREWTSRPRGSGSRAARGLVIDGGVDWRVSASIAPPGTRIPHTPRRFPAKTTLHPARIPREVAGSSRTRPAIPASHVAEILPRQEIPAYPRLDRKRHDRPVTPEVAGSSPVAPVKGLQIGISCSQQARTTAGLPIHLALTRMRDPSPVRCWKSAYSVWSRARRSDLRSRGTLRVRLADQGRGRTDRRIRIPEAARRARSRDQRAPDHAAPAYLVCPYLLSSAEGSPRSGARSPSTASKRAIRMYMLDLLLRERQLLRRRERGRAPVTPAANRRPRC